MADDPRVHIGPAGWSYDDWEGIVYGSGLGVARLDAVADLFRVIEINSTFYGTPSPRTTEGWARRVAHRTGFQFTAKLVKVFTHDDPRHWTLKARDEFRDAMKPLSEAGLLGAVLAQFPWFYQAGESNLTRLQRIRNAFPDLPLVLEVRHRSWLEEGWLEKVSSLGYSFCNVDQPLASSSIELTSLITGPLGYLRLHGRNRDKWFSKDAQVHEKYDYLYSEAEIERLVKVCEELRARTDRMFVIANNHFEGKGPANALEIYQALTGETVRVPPGMLAAFPHLERLKRLQLPNPHVHHAAAGAH